MVGRIADWWAFELFEARESVAEVVLEIGLRHNVEQLFILSIDIRTEAFDALIVGAPNAT